MSIDPGGFSISTSERDGRSIVVVRGELDLATAPELEDVVDRCLTQGQEVVIDLRELDFMDSSGLRVLVAAHARAGRDRGRFAVVRPVPGGAVARIFDVAGIEDELNVVDEP